jgi:hypothetical protein
MLVETVLGVIIDLVFGLIGLIVGSFPAAPTFRLPFPRIIWELLQPAFMSVMLFFPAGMIWWLWKQLPISGSK